MSSEGALRDGKGAGFQLIETMRWEQQRGFLRFDRHLARLYASARALGFTYDPEQVGRVLNVAVGGSRDALRVRLLLSPDGEATASAQPYAPVPEHEAWTVRIARTRLDSGNALVRHKTTRRETYMDARAEYQAHQAEEVLLLNERREVCEGTITNVFVDMGEDALLTPALTCGLLPGVLRAELIDEGRAREAMLGPADLTEARALFVGNSVRGLIRARLGE